VWVVFAGAVFVLFVAAVVLSSVSRRRPVGRPASILTPGPESDGILDRTLTLDGRAADTWLRVDLSTGGEVTSADATTWDVAVKRHLLIVNGGPGFRGDAGVIGFRGISFDAVVEAPDRGYAGSEVSRGGDTVTAALEEWYDYSFLSHLLTPAEVVYVIRTADGRYAKLEVLDYYCPGAEPGCLTLRYTYQGDGTRRLAP